MLYVFYIYIFFYCHITCGYSAEGNVAKSRQAALVARTLSNKPMSPICDLGQWSY